MAKKKRSYPPAAAAAPVPASRLALLLLLLLLAGDALPQTRRSRGAAQPPKDALALANLYYTSNDVSDRAAAEYRRVRNKYKGTAEAATAQYFLASYYQRKFYIIKEKSGSGDAGALAQAAAEYDAYTRSYARANSSELLSDARFNLALVYMELGKLDPATKELGRLRDEDAAKDGSVYIRQVVWTSNQKDVIDGNFNARELAEVARIQLQQTRSAERTVRAVKEWCWNNRSQKK